MDAKPNLVGSSFPSTAPRLRQLEAPTAAPQQLRVMRKTILYLLLLVLLLLIAFVVQNTQTVELSFLWMSFTTTASLLVLMFLVVGVVSGWILSRLLEVRMRSRKAQKTQTAAYPS